MLRGAGIRVSPGTVLSTSAVLGRRRGADRQRLIGSQRLDPGRRKLVCGRWVNVPASAQQRGERRQGGSHAEYQEQALVKWSRYQIREELPAGNGLLS